MNKAKKYNGKVDSVQRMKQYENIWNKNEKRKKKIFKSSPKIDEPTKYDKEKGIVRNIYGDIIQTEKEKYEKLSETFIKIKCLLNLDCEPGNEREYIKNFFIKFGYNNNDITEDKISNFLNFINEEPFPIDPKKTLKEK